MALLFRRGLPQGLAIVAALFTVLLFALKLDIEQYLKQNVPGNPMPDAFNGLNGSIPIFMLLVTATLQLVTRLIRKRLYLLLLPLLFGPFVCLVGWFNGKFK